MSDILTGDFRESDRLRVLRHPARSRADVGRRLGLSRATVTTVLSELDRAGMVEQQGDEKRRLIGRPPLRVSLAPSAANAVGLDFGHRHIHRRGAAGARRRGDRHGAR